MMCKFPLVLFAFLFSSCESFIRGLPVITKCPPIFDVNRPALSVESASFLKNIISYGDSRMARRAVGAFYQPSK